MGHSKSSPRRKVHIIIGYLKNQEKSQKKISNLTLTLKRTTKNNEQKSPELVEGRK